MKATSQRTEATWITLQAKVRIRTSFVAFHRWKDAPADVIFLRDYHRHIFGVCVGLPVSGDDRQIEFFQAKRAIDSYLSNNLTGGSFDYSCETFASMIAKFCRQHFNTTFVEVEVDEDAENSSVVLYGVGV